jgi:two-component system, cell cycle response regulator
MSMVTRWNLMQSPLAPSRAAREVFRALPAVGVCLAFALMARGRWRDGLHLSSEELGVLGLIFAGLVVTSLRRFRRTAQQLATSFRDDIEFGSTLLTTAFVAVSLSSDLFFPVVYALLAYLVTLLSRSAAATLFGVAVLFDAVMTLPERVAVFGARTAFLVLFAGLYHWVLASRLAAARTAEHAAVKNKIKEVEERARTFRLVSSGAESVPGIQDQEKWLLAAVKEIEGATGNALEVVETALKTHSVAVFLLSSDDRSLKLHDCRSESDFIQRERFSAGEGLFGALLKRGVPVRMHSSAALKGITHYESAGPSIRAIAAVPILEGAGLVRGVLVADRLDDVPFSDADERVLTITANEVLRAIEIERVMSYIRRSRDEKDRFFRAIEELNRAQNPDQVFLAVLESARQIAPLDFCAVTLVSEANETPHGAVQGRLNGQGNETKNTVRYHKVMRMTGVTSSGRALEGLQFADNHGLVANVVRYGAPLPGRDVGAMDRQVIFDDETQIRGLHSLKIFPLVAANRILGTLVVGSRKKANFDSDELRMLEVIAIQAAQAVLRAQLFEQMEKMATTDGLTGLLNHRTFQTRFDEALATAARYGRKLSFVLTDVDKFKAVNDTYGHPMGDQVLKGVAKILKEQARDTDIVARYGGEEFALVMPETDAAGAQVIAERIRERLMREVFHTDKGPLTVTLSLGIATSPDVSKEKHQLIELADQCLYFCKRNGRNQSITATQMLAQRTKAAVH